jgi:hypothetical protein
MTNKGKVVLFPFLHVSTKLQQLTTTVQQLSLLSKIHKIEYSKKHFFFYRQLVYSLAHRVTDTKPNK